MKKFNKIDLKKYLSEVEKNNSPPMKKPFSSVLDLTVETLEKGDIKTHDKRVVRYSKARLKATEHLEYIINNHPTEKRLINSLENCGNYLVFHNYYRLGQIRLAALCTCKKHLICPLCAIRRGSKQVHAYMEKLSLVFSENPGLNPYLVTLTVKNGNDLLERYNHLKSSIQYLYKKRHLKEVHTESSKALGAVWSYEVKRGSNSGSWHPHAHAIWLCDEPPSESALSEEWKKITGDSHIVDIRPIKADDDEILAKSLCEVFKYAVKFSDQPPQDTYECYLKLSRKRLLGSLGCLYGVVIPEPLEDDLIENEPYFELFYRYSYGNYYLVEENVI